MKTLADIVGLMFVLADRIFANPNHLALRARITAVSRAAG
jgi:hypothetical protein